MKVLSERQKNFCFEYLKDFNANQAAIRAGYSKKIDNHNAHLLLQNPLIIKFLGSLKKEHIEKAHLTIDEVVNELKSIAFAPVDDNRIKAENKIRALELLGRYLGMFNDRDKAPENSNIKVRIFIFDKVGGSSRELINPNLLNLPPASDN